MVTLYKVWSRTVVVSLAIALSATSLASAQSPNAASPSETPAPAKLLSEAAFARLAQSPHPDVAHAPAAPSPGPTSFLRQARAAGARQAQAPKPTSAPAPKQDRSWMARHKWYFIVPAIVAGGILGTLGLMIAYGDD